MNDITQNLARCHNCGHFLIGRIGINQPLESLDAVALCCKSPWHYFGKVVHGKWRKA